MERTSPEPPTADAPQAPAEAAVRATGERIAAALPGRSRGPAARLDERVMGLVAADPQLRAALFRFVDVRPACTTRAELVDHLVHLLDEVQQPTAPVALARSIAARRITRPLTARVAGAAVDRLAKTFIVGESAAGALPQLQRLWTRGLCSSVDLLGEATVTEAEADVYQARCAQTLQALAAAQPAWPQRPLLEGDRFGAIPRTNLSVKVSALTTSLRPEEPRRGIDGAAGRLRELLRQARDLGAHLHVDMESLAHREAVHRLVLELLSEAEFRDGPSVGVVVQAYLRDAGEIVGELIDWNARAGRTTPLTVRLVKGAYWDHEVVEAAQRGWPVPVFEQRADSDRSFEALTLRLLDAAGHVRLAIASHNLRSVAHAAEAARERGLGAGELEFQILRGLGDELGEGLASLGHRTRVYAPIGEIVAGMAYLVRRLLENTSNDSFLLAQSQGRDLTELLAKP